MKQNEVMNEWNIFVHVTLLDDEYYELLIRSLTFMLKYQLLSTEK